jgi:predicted nucleotidyltransferase component of viral defense system
MSETGRLRLHEDPQAFRDLLTLTAARAGFLVRLVEKDYFCSVLLQYLAASCTGLVFKGGTCLAKVHADFHRMSEDLDFTVPVPIGSARSARSRLIEEVKRAMADVERQLPVFRTVTPLRGANESTQYNATVVFSSRVATGEEAIKVEVGLREPLLTPTVSGQVRTLLSGLASDRPLVPTFSVTCLSHVEAMAEKVRAALSRRDAAIRDFYDVDHAAQHGFPVGDAAFLELVRRKLDVSGTATADVSPARFALLRGQVDTALKPVLRPADFAGFDLERSFATLSAVAAAVSRTP